MSDFAGLIVAFLFCIVPPTVIIGGIVALVYYLKKPADHRRVDDLEVAVATLVGENLTLRDRLSQLERAVGAQQAGRATESSVQAWSPPEPEPRPKLAALKDIVESAREPAALPASASATAHAPETPSVAESPSAPDTASAAETATASETTTEPEPASEPATATASEPEPASASEPEPETTTESEPATASEPESEPETTTEPEPATTTEPAPASEPETEPAPGAAPQTAPVPAAAPPPARDPSIDWEQWIGVKGAAALGASILVLSGIYFFEYSIEHGLITPAMRMIAGTLVGLACVAVSELRLRRTHDVLAGWIAGAGIAILYVAFWAGKALYELYPTWAAGILMVATTGACVTLAVKRRSIPVALLGLAGGFVTPLALSTGSDRPISLFSYLLLLDGAMLWLAYRRRWPWLAALCLVGTLAYQESWLLARLDEPRLVLGVIIVAVFAALFAALPQRTDEAGDEGLIWKLTRSAGVLLPLLFTVPLALRNDIGDTFWATAVQLVLLCAAACYLGLRNDSRLLPVGAALTAAVTIFARMLVHEPDAPVEVWLSVGLALVLMAVFHVFAELGRRRGEERTHLGISAIVFGLSVLGLTAIGAPFASAAGPWPWLVLWLAAGASAVRLGALVGRPEVQLAAAALTAVGLGGNYAFLAGTGGQPSAGLFLGCLVGGAVLTQLPGLLPGVSPGTRRFGDHSGALFAVIAIPFVAMVGTTVTVPGWVFYAATFGLAVLVLLAAARRSSSTWVAITALVTAATHGVWIARRAHGPFGAAELGALFGAVLLFSIFPVVAPRRLREQPWAWRTAALAGPLYLLTLRHVYLDVLGASTIGALAIALAAVSIGAAYAVRVRGPEAPEARKTATVWLTATAAGFVTLAIPLQLENEWITIGWSLEALAMTVLWRRLDHPGLKYLAFALAAAVCVRLMANPYVLGYYPRSELRILNWLTYTYLVPAACLVGMWWQLRIHEVERLRGWEKAVYPEKAMLASLAASAAVVVVFAWINLTIFDWFAVGSQLEIPTDRLPARDLTLSIAWVIYAVCLVALGMWRRSTPLRVTSLALILLICAKVFLYDLAHLEDLYRVASLAGLALSLIVISFAYKRFVFPAAEPAEKVSS